MKSFYLILLKRRIKLCEWCINRMNKLIIKEVSRKNKYEKLVEQIDTKIQDGEKK